MTCVMDNHPSLVKRNSLPLRYCHRVVGSVQLDPWPKPISTKVGHRCKVQRALSFKFEVIRQPAKERADFGAIKVLQVDLEVFWLEGNPDANAEVVGVVMNGNLDDPSDEVMLIVDDAEVRVEL
jgi:hypothetical protein